MTKGVPITEPKTIAEVTEQWTELHVSPQQYSECPQSSFVQQGWPMQPNPDLHFPLQQLSSTLQSERDEQVWPTQLDPLTQAFLQQVSPSVQFHSLVQCRPTQVDPFMQTWPQQVWLASQPVHHPSVTEDSDETKNTNNGAFLKWRTEPPNTLALTMFVRVLSGGLWCHVRSLAHFGFPVWGWRNDFFFLF